MTANTIARPEKIDFAYDAPLPNCDHEKLTETEARFQDQTDISHTVINRPVRIDAGVGCNGHVQSKRKLQTSGATGAAASQQTVSMKFAMGFVVGATLMHFLPSLTVLSILIVPLLFFCNAILNCPLCIYMED